MTTTTPTESAEELRRRLVDRLESAGALTSAWRAPFLAVPRENFVRRFVIRLPHGQQTFDPDTEGYLRAVYDDTSLITQHDSGGTATSSSSQPSVMATMLAALGDLPRGTRVLEVGTGTGYNAALLSHKVGDDAFTSIDIDPGLTHHARAALRRTGYAPTLITGDGTTGHPDHAPYESLIATCGVGRVPASWLAQVRPGGVIVANLGLALVVLQVAEAGGASGSLLPMMAGFMTARLSADAPAPAVNRDVSELLAAKGARRAVPFPDPAGGMAQLLLHLVLPDVETLTFNSTGENAQTIHCLTHRPTGSWARIVPQGGGVVQVDHDGPRDLFSEVAPLVSHWAQVGRAGPGRYGLTVDPDGRHDLWFDSPDGPHWHLP